MERQERAELAIRMREQGVPVPVIAETLGVAKKTVYLYFYDPDGEKKKKQYVRYWGKCAWPGCEEWVTKYDPNGTTGATHCMPHAHLLKYKEYYYTDEELIWAMREMTRKLKRLPTRGDDITLASYQVFVDHFGSWTNGVAAAGLVPIGIGRGQAIERKREINAENYRRVLGMFKRAPKASEKALRSLTAKQRRRRASRS